jgi:nucleoside-diphosphate-sugar epimerase
MIKPRILVTGATGKTGSVVVSELLKAGYAVRALVRLEDGRSAGLNSQRPSSFTPYLSPRISGNRSRIFREW